MTYDALAFSTKPLFYLSAPTLTDRILSGLYPITTNNLSVSQQPIILGHDSSFLVDADDDIVIDGNPVFFKSGAAIEFVFLAQKPTDEYAILIDPDNNNGIYADPEGISLRLFFDVTEGIISKNVRIEVKKWDVKKHVIVRFSENNADIIVNGQSANIIYDGTGTTVNECHLGYNLNGNVFKIDGFGIYSNFPADKSNVIDDPGSGHGIIASGLYNGLTTGFEMSNIGFDITINSTDFIALDDHFTYNFSVYRAFDEYKYIMIIPDDDNASLSYIVNDGVETELNDFGYAALVDDGLIILNALNLDSIFSIRLVAVLDRFIFMRTPAQLDLTGVAHYPMTTEESVVNNPKGVRLLDASYDGTWIVGMSNPDLPKTIELVFKAHDVTEKTYVFSSSDGEISYGPSGAISGYTTYLNGSVVTDLNSIEQDTWYHLVLKKSTPATTTFKLNNDVSDPRSNEISYLFLTAYPSELSAGIITSLYELTFGIDSASAEENSATFQEGEFPSTNPYRIYSFAWAIVGAGG